MNIVEEIASVLVKNLFKFIDNRNIALQNKSSIQQREDPLGSRLNT